MTCYEHAVKQHATFFGLHHGNYCFFGDEKSDLTISGDILPDSQCYQDCSSVEKTRKEYLKSGNHKCGSHKTTSVFQIAYVMRNLGYRTDATTALSKFIKINFIDRKRYSSTDLLHNFNLKGQYVFVGCYKDRKKIRLQPVLSSTYTIGGSFGQDECMKYARKANSDYFGLQSGTKCSSLGD